MSGTDRQRDGGGTSRREFLARMSACMALAAAAGCRRPRAPEAIVPWVDAPPGVTPGVPLRYATALTLGGYGTGVLVETREGRPLRIDGNPDHPASLGAVDARTQAEILELYDPDRSRAIRHREAPAEWRDLRAALDAALEPVRRAEGAGLHLLTGTTTSPTQAALLARIRAELPGARWHRWEPIHRDEARRGARLAFGRDVDVLLDYTQADVLLALDADPFSTPPGRLAHARGVAAAHLPPELGGIRPSMSRIYAAESTPSLFGANADHRLPLPAARIPQLLRRIAARLGVVAEAAEERLGERERRFADAVADDLRRAGTNAAIAVADTQPAAVHALAHAVLASLGAFGTVARCIDPVEADPVLHLESIAALAESLERDEVDILLVLDGNPVLTAPAEFDLAEKLARAELSVHLGLRDDETAARCTWHVPLAHELETWGDCRAFDGTATIQQPAITPLFGGRTGIEICAIVLGERTPAEPARAARRLVEAHWRETLDDAGWRAALRTGVVTGTAAATLDLQPSLEITQLVEPSEEAGLELAFRPHPALWDGRFANNPWLQELPDPFTKITWTDAALIAPALARRLELEDDDEVELVVAGRTVRCPVHVLPGQAEGTVTIRTGYGGTRCGSTGSGRGIDAHRLRTSDASWSAQGLELRATGRRLSVPRTQRHAGTEERDPVVVATLDEFHATPDEIADGERHTLPDVTLADAFPLDAPHQWGMAIDLTSCIGCNACVIACQAENNVPTVGPEQVAIGRAMHWLRVDRYLDGSVDDPSILFQPLACVHCESAPCEYVCPVGATVHSPEGLNEMVYNRCIGTRYCSNNCPYKVRRFNFLDYTGDEPGERVPQRNPEVTVRARGVMEKCTYCVQRINKARIEAKIEGRRIPDGAVVTACQSVCPTEAIVFGDVSDPGTAVSRAKARSIDYLLLGHLNTRPRTSYGAVVRNPNPELAS